MLRALVFYREWIKRTFSGPLGIAQAASFIVWLVAYYLESNSPDWHGATHMTWQIALLVFAVTTAYCFFKAPLDMHNEVAARVANEGDLLTALDFYIRQFSDGTFDVSQIDSVYAFLSDNFGDQSCYRFRKSTNDLVELYEGRAIGSVQWKIAMSKAVVCLTGIRSRATK